MMDTSSVPRRDLPPIPSRCYHLLPPDFPRGAVPQIPSSSSCYDLLPPDCDVELQNWNFSSLQPPDIPHREVHPISSSSSCYDLLPPDCDVELQNWNFSSLQPPDIPRREVAPIPSSSSCYDLLPPDCDVELQNWNFSSLQPPDIPRREVPPLPSSSSCYDLLPPDCDVELQNWNFSSLQPPDNSPDRGIPPIPRRCYHLLPPDFSEIRVVLLGNSQPERTEVMNFILGVPVFNTQEDPDLLSARGLLHDKEMVLVNAPDLLQPNISNHKLAQLVESCTRLCDPGPHVFLLVLQPEDFTRAVSLRLSRVLQLFGDGPLDHALVLVSTPRRMFSRFMLRYKLLPPIQDKINVSSRRLLWRKNLKHPELFNSLVQILTENNGKYVTRHQEETNSGGSRFSKNT